ncbi:MAG: GTPase domain-containing protein [Proteobacteria bacterium]|nr:GTPase domain-containing protein [Pseudomonadota bacterium]
MAVINLKKREIQIKIVYYGPGKCGKTTNLEYIYKKNKTRLKSDLLQIDTRGAMSLFFDFLPFDLGKINGFDIKVQLYTVPGKEMYESNRQVVLNGVDGVVFVADSSAESRNRNIVSFNSLKKNLARNKKSVGNTPLVIQCNKSDLAKEGVTVLPRNNIARDLRVETETPCLEASAISGSNVISTLKKIILLTMRSMEKEIKKHVMSWDASLDIDQNMACAHA